MEKTNLDDLLNSFVEETKQIMKNVVVAVPFTPSTCVFVRNRERPDIEETISMEAFVSVLHLINMKNVMMSRSEVYSDRDYGYILETIRTFIPTLLSSDPFLKLKIAIMGHDDMLVIDPFHHNSSNNH